MAPFGVAAATTGRTTASVGSPSLRGDMDLVPRLRTIGLRDGFPVAIGKIHRIPIVKEAVHLTPVVFEQVGYRIRLVIPGLRAGDRDVWRAGTQGKSHDRESGPILFHTC